METTTTHPHGERGERLTVILEGQHDTSRVTLTGSLRWCEKCGAWQRAVGIIAGFACPKCKTLWEE